ncbi:MAG: aspartyl protease family protein [Hyphomonas sp.]|nr:aspartyl protease family protein [Hyphomonas sp.]
MIWEKKRRNRLIERWHLNGAMLVALALLTGAPALAGERLIIPFEMNVHDQIVVDLQVNDDIRSTGVVDTAATFPMIDGHTARIAGVLNPGENPDMVNVLGLTGTAMYPVVRLDKLLVGGILKTDIAAALNRQFDVPGARNVLPSSAFEGDIMDFDFKNQRIMFYDGRPDRKGFWQPSTQDIDLIDGLMFIEVRVNGKRGRALIDTGSSITYINSHFAREAGTKANEKLTRTLQGATGGDQSMRIASAGTMNIGEHRLKRLNLLVADPPLFHHLGMGEEPVMVLGLDVLSLFRVQIDRRHDRLILSLPNDRRKRGVWSYSPVDTYTSDVRTAGVPRP